jgi:hypothetical protein
MPARKFVCPLLIASSVWLAACTPAQIETVPVPFAKLIVDGKVWQIEKAPEDEIFALRQDSRHIQLPKGAVPLLGMTLKNGQTLVVVRETLGANFGALLLPKSGSGHAKALRIQGDWARNLLPHHLIELDNVPILFAYDVDKTKPSGSSSSGTKDGISILSLEIKGSALTIQPIAETMPIGGIDPFYRDFKTESGAVVCTMTACMAMRLDPKDGPVLSTRNFANRTGKDLIDVVSDGKSTFGLFRLSVDDRFVPLPKTGQAGYFVCDMENDVPCEDIAMPSVPYLTGITGEKPQVSFAKTSEQLSELFLRDLERLPLAGMTYYGMDNSEGRIAWGQIYYLEGLSAIANKEAFVSDQKIVKASQDRLAIEVGPILTLLKGGAEALTTKRYSLGRAPLLSSMHLGRMSTALSNVAVSSSRGEEIRSALSIIKPELMSGEKSFEYPEFNPSFGWYLQLRKGAKFWADGGNGPWNYQSGWVIGVNTYFEQGGDPKLREIIKSMCQHFIVGTDMASLPTSWNYSWGPVFEGWSEKDNVSVNTPNWKGDKTNTNFAHISYRSMDAMALFSTWRTFEENPNPQIRGHLMKLVNQGHLYPFVSREILASGLKVTIDPSILAYYSRSANTYEVQNSAWTLSGSVTPSLTQLAK